jgi:hypothetical protein
MKQGPVLIGKFVAWLTQETNADKAVWHSEMLNIYSCSCEGFKIWTDWERDDRPQLSVNDAYFEGYGYGIQELREAIYNQFKRQGRYQLSGGTGILPKDPAALEQESAVLTQIGKFLDNTSRA